MRLIQIYEIDSERARVIFTSKYITDIPTVENIARAVYMIFFHYYKPNQMTGT